MYKKQLFVDNHEAKVDPNLTSDRHPNCCSRAEAVYEITHAFKLTYERLDSPNNEGGIRAMRYYCFIGLLLLE